MVDEKINPYSKRMSKSGSNCVLYCTSERLPTVAAIDYFKSFNTTCYVFEKPTKKSLRQVLESKAKTCVTEAQARVIMYNVLKAVKELHLRNVKHGNLNLDTILAKKTTNGWDIQLDGFEFAIMK